MDIDQLRALAAVGRLGSFSAAAHELALSQPTISRQIQRLEQEIGARLLDRTGRRAELTPAGQKANAFGLATLDALDALRREVDAMARPAMRRLRIAASTAPAEHILPAALGPFQRAHPTTEIVLLESDSAAAYATLADGAVDLAVVGALPDQVPAALRCAPIASDLITLIVCEQHPFARRISVSPRELRDEVIIDREPGSGTLHILRRLLGELGYSLASGQGTMVMGSTRAVLAAVRHGLGVGFVSSLALRDGGAGVRAVPLDCGELRRSLYVVYRRDQEGDDVLADFVRCLAATAMA